MIGNNCAGSTLRCSYTRLSKKRGPRPGYIDDLENRVRHLEGLLARKPDDIGDPQRQDSRFYDMISTSTSGESAASPSKELRIDLIEDFFNFVHPIWPIFHKPTFLENLTSHSILLLEAMYALAMPFTVIPPAIPFASGDAYAAKARACIHDAFDTVDFSTVAGLFLLAVYIGESGQLTESWVYCKCMMILVGMALRIGQQLGLHCEDKKHSSLIEKESKRRLWWCMYLFDRENCIGSQLPFAMRAFDFDINYPCDDSEWSLLEKDDQIIVTQGSRCPSSTLGHLLVLYQILSEIVTLDASLRSTAVVAEPARISELEFQANRLDERLSVWFDHIPPQIRHVVEAYDSGERIEWGVPFVLLMFYHSRLLIHTRRLINAIQFDPAVAGSHPSFFIVKSCADAVTQIVRMFLKSNPNFFYVSPFVSRCMYFAGMSHLVTLDTYPAPTCPPRNTVFNCVDTHLDALQRLQSRYFYARTDFGGLQGLKFQRMSKVQYGVPPVAYPGSYPSNPGMSVGYPARTQ